MELLGHSGVGMTLNTYSHVIPQLRQEAADRMNEILELEP
jgi:integrase